jgi:micrococcal nuclease|tara:strand:+ start:1237 stop:2277 length:1041 start_codon:yes stop_codon:yes gene_type:complete
MCVDTEESSIPRGTSRHYKPITYGGREADAWLKEHLGVKHDGRPRPSAPISCDIEFDTTEPTIIGCRRHNEENYGRMLAYVHVGGRPVGENLSLAVVRAGRSPYFTKYGRSRLYHAEFLQAEQNAMSDETGLWGIMNAVGERSVPVSDYVRNYTQLLPWWSTREGIVEDFRRWQREGVARHVLVPRVHHEQLVKAAVDGETITVLVDLQPKDAFLMLGVMRNVEYADEQNRPRTGTVIHAGPKAFPFNLWLDHAFSEESEKIKALIERRYSRGGRNYAYVTGKAFMYRKKQIPQILVTRVSQFSDAPVKDAAALHHAGEKYHIAAASMPLEKHGPGVAAAAVGGAA